MEDDIYVKFLFDYDHELGYTENVEHISKDQIQKNKWKNGYYFIWPI